MRNQVDPLSFPKGLDCILSRLRMTSPSMTTNTRSVSDASPFPVITGLGDKHAGCPILLIITIPEFIILSQLVLSELTLVQKGSKGVPEQQGVSQSHNTLLATSMVRGSFTDLL